MAIVIVVLVALVVRSRRKRKILEHDILELRQQSSSVPLTPSTPLVDLEPVPAELVGDPWRDTLGGEGVVRKNSSKSESSVSGTFQSHKLNAVNVNGPCW